VTIGPAHARSPAPVAPHLSNHRAGFPFSCIGSVEKNQMGIRRNGRFSPTKESQQNQTLGRIKRLGDRVQLVWEISEQTALYRALVLLRILALASLPRRRRIVLEPPHTKSTTPGGSPRPAAPVEAFPNAGAPPPRARTAVKACGKPAATARLFLVVSAVQGRTR
jgi:hypothetical protein